jgi:hypothetical protein
MPIQAPVAALYYPHWEISDARFLFEALTFWDYLWIIGPDKHHQPKGQHADPQLQKEIAAIHERFVKVLVPNEDQKKKAHNQIAGLLTQDAPHQWDMRHLLKPEIATLANDKFLSVRPKTY